MKIYDPDTKRTLNNIILFLTEEEAAELGFSATDLFEHPEKQHHHINDANYKNEITISVYTEDNIDLFDEESKRVILETE